MLYLTTSRTSRTRGTCHTYMPHMQIEGELPRRQYWSEYLLIEDGGVDGHHEWIPKKSTPKDTRGEKVEGRGEQASGRGEETSGGGEKEGIGGLESEEREEVKEKVDGDEEQKSM